MNIYKQKTVLIAATFAALLLTACGGGSSSSTAAPTVAPTPSPAAPTTLRWDQGNWGTVNWQ